MKTPIETEILISSLTTQLRADMQRLERGEDVGDSGVRAPRVGGAEDRKYRAAKSIARILFPNTDENRSTSYIRYSQTISKLRKARLKQVEETKFRSLNNPLFRQARAHGQRHVFEQLLDEPVSDEITNPTPMPVQTAPETELNPIFRHLHTGEGTSRPCEQFTRGAIYNDGRVDMCKQVVGDTFIGNFTESVTGNSNIRHFLLGNNVVGDTGAQAIARMIQHRSEDNPIDTLYLAGNCFSANGAKSLANALKNNHTAKSLWLKRNPLGAGGVIYLAEMLRENHSLSTLDLVNTNTGDKGVIALFDALRDNTGLKTLYLDANAITVKGCQAIADYFEYCKSKNKAGLSGLFLGVNRIGDAGAEIIANAISGYKHLVRLDLSSNRIQQTGLQAVLQAAQGLPYLSYLGLGYYKSTADLGELPNYFDGNGAELLANFIAKNSTLTALDICDVNLRPDAWELIADAMKQNTSLYDLKCSQLGFKVPKEILHRIHSILDRNVQAGLGITYQEFKGEPLRFLKHTDQIRHIDSIYRNNM